MKLTIPKLPKGHYIRTEQGVVILFAASSSFILGGMLAYGLYLSPLQLNNWLAEAILVGIFVLSARPLWQRRHGPSYRPTTRNPLK